MGLIKQAKANTMADHAARARQEGRKVFVAQLRGGMGHSPKLSRPIQDVAEMIEGIEAKGWKLDQFTSVPYDGNMTVTCLFRPAPMRTEREPEIFDLDALEEPPAP